MACCSLQECSFLWIAFLPLSAIEFHRIHFLVDFTAFICKFVVIFKRKILPELSPYLHTDYTEVYKPIMQFNRNKTAFIHQWYPFVEGYSKEFITNIIDEINYEPQFALDPFAGSGTTLLAGADLQSVPTQTTSYTYIHQRTNISNIPLLPA